jgi:SAM-dependent methyltransferase
MSVAQAAPQLKSPSLKEVLSKDLQEMLFPKYLKLVPQLNEVYELELAYYESRILSETEILRNGAYFASVSEQPTRHFLMCQGEPLKLADHSSSRLKSFFKTNQFKTGYATHGLFPYRGKFHPQMIKGLINIMGLKPGDTVLDPMMGSGTVLIEATLMGINSVGIDASPFCEFMARAKVDGLTIPFKYVRAALDDFETTYRYFSAKVAGMERATSQVQRSLFGQDAAAEKTEGPLPRGCKRKDVHDYLMLAFLDAKGYAERSQRKSFREQFKAILERYYFAAEKIQRVLNGLLDELGHAIAMEGDARKLSLDDNSIDGIIFSPPYSFAIDYLENDEYHLRSLGVDVEELRKSMIGLRGTRLNNKYDLYVEDMTRVVAECSRVLKPGKICSIVVGTNNNQLSKILNVAPEEVTGIDKILSRIGEAHGMELVRKIERQITGMANTMRSEFIVMLQKKPDGVRN